MDCKRPADIDPIDCYYVSNRSTLSQQVSPFVREPSHRVSGTGALRPGEAGVLVDVRAVAAAAVAAGAPVPQVGGGEGPPAGGRVEVAVLAGGKGQPVGGQDGLVVRPCRVEPARVGHGQR